MSSLSLSHVPRAWILFHSLLCLFGVANISFLKSVPLMLRIVSLVYNVLVVVSTLSIFVMLYEEIDWKQDLFNVIEHVGVGVWVGTFVVLSITSLINVYGGNILHFLHSWNIYMDKADNVNQIHKRHTCINWRSLYVIVVISRAIIHVFELAIILPLFDITYIAQLLFPSLSNNVLLRTCSAFLVYINCIFPCVLICWLGMYCAVMSNLSEKFINLREEISNYSTSELKMSNLVSCRCYYVELTGLVSQADTVIRWFIGYGLSTEIIILCASLYTLITTSNNIIFWCDVASSLMVIWMYLAPAVTVSREVSQYGLKAMYSYVHSAIIKLWCYQIFDKASN